MSRAAACPATEDIRRADSTWHSTACASSPLQRQQTRDQKVTDEKGEGDKQKTWKPSNENKNCDAIYSPMFIRNRSVSML